MSVVNHIKTSKTSLILNMITTLIICVLCFMLWYLYAHSLPTLTNTDKISAVLNFFVAIGTIGAVLVSLHLSINANKSALKIRIQQAMGIGIELLDMMSKYDFILLSKLDGNDEKELNLSVKINEFLWHIALITNENDASEIINTILAVHKHVTVASLDVIKSVIQGKIVIKPEDNFIEIYKKYQIKESAELTTTLKCALIDKFKKLNNEHYFNQQKDIYLKMSKNILNNY